MGIPVGSFYQKKHLGAGTVATIENNTVNTVTASEDIGFGCAIDIKDGKAVLATKAPIFGVAIKREFIQGDHLSDLADDHFRAGETFGAMRKGGIDVPISEDVDRYDQATVNADGSFKKAGAGEPVVGRFLKPGNAGGTTELQIELTDMGTTGTGTSTQTASTTPTTPPKDNTPKDNTQGGSK